MGLAETRQELTTRPNWSILLRRRSRGEAEKEPELQCSEIPSELTQKKKTASNTKLWGFSHPKLESG